MDTSRLLTNMYQDLQGSQFNDYRDLRDQKIADPDDMQRELKCDSFGGLTNLTFQPMDLANIQMKTTCQLKFKIPAKTFENVIGKAPFVDVSAARDYEY